MATLLKTWDFSFYMSFQNNTQGVFFPSFLIIVAQMKHKWKGALQIVSCFSLCLELWQTLGTDVFHSSGLWTDIPKVNEEQERNPPFLAVYFSKPFVPTVREHIPESAELVGKHPVINMQDCKAMSENHPVSRTLNVIRSLLPQPCQVVTLLLLTSATFWNSLPHI